MVITSPQLITKQRDGVYHQEERERENADGSIEKYTETITDIEPVEGMVFDEVIEYQLNDSEGNPLRVAFEGGKVIDWNDSEEKAREDEENARIAQKMQEENRVRILARPSEIILQLGELKKKKDGLELLGEDTSEVDEEIAELREIYQEAKEATLI